jgi:curli biogenesis system outer membrane secretion channel CsgG
LSGGTLSGLKIFMLIIWIGCSAVPAKPLDLPVVAVWDLEHLSLQPQADEEMGEILSAKVIETIQASGSYRVVERERLILVLEELSIGSSTAADRNTRLKVGSILGARFMVFGTCFEMQGTVRIDLRLVEVETGHILKTARRTTRSTNRMEWLDLTEDAARELL